MIVVIPAYEPDDKLTKLVLELHEKTDYSIVIVDDGSVKAHSKEVFESVQHYADVIHHEVNKGKGRAMKTAFEYIKNNCGKFASDELIVTVDADGQHLLHDIVRICGVAKENPDSLIIGSRAFKGEVPLRSRIGNGITRFVFAITTGVRVHDTQTGLRAFSVGLIDEMLAIQGDRYEYEINQLLTCTRKHIRIIEEEIETVYINENETSHFNVVRDSWRIYKSIFAFIGSSFICWIVDYILLLLLTGLFSSITDGNGFTAFGLSLEPKLPALIIARAVSSILNFVLNKNIVFKSGTRSSIFKYYITVVLVLVVNYLLLNLLTGAGVKLAIAQILSQIIIYPINYVIQRRFVFNDNGRA